MKKIIVAIDGYSACGKSTLAKDLASHYSYTYIDTGAMYRAVAYYALHILSCPSSDNLLVIDRCRDDIISRLNDITITFANVSGGQHTVLNGEDIEDKIRNSIIGQNASLLGTIREVRQHLVRLQQRMGQDKQIVMDGRDIGTVVFPNAELKLFLTASFDVRVKRRYLQLYDTANFDEKKYKEIEDEMRERDYRDTHREESPLVMAEDAILIDNSNLTQMQQLAKVVSIFDNIVVKE